MQPLFHDILVKCDLFVFFESGTDIVRVIAKHFGNLIDIESTVVIYDFFCL